MKRASDTNITGIKKFLVRQGTTCLDPLPVESEKNSNLNESVSVAVPKKHRLSGFNPDWKKEYPWVEEAENGRYHKDLKSYNM
jgi:hypothetical protein